MVRILTLILCVITVYMVPICTSQSFKDTIWSIYETIVNKKDPVSSESISESFKDKFWSIYETIVNKNNPVSSKSIPESFKDKFWSIYETIIADNYPISSINLVVAPEDYPESCLTSEQAEEFKSHIMMAIEITPKDGLSPNFNYCRFEKGSLIFSCKNAETSKWLQSAVEEIVNWSGPKLHVMPYKDLPKSVKTEVFIPGPIEEPKTIVKKLQIQNIQTFNTKEWIVVDRMQKKYGQQLIIVMDELSWKNMEKINYKPFFNFGKVYFRYFEKNNNFKESKDKTEPIEKTTV